MRYIKGLTKDTLKLLKRIYKQSKYYQVRQRAHCIELSYQGYCISELMEIFQVSRNTIYNWFNAWESSKFSGLYNSSGRGRKKLFTVEHAWQARKQKIEIPSQQSKRLNVLGFLTRDNQLEVYTFNCSINSDVVIACLDKFC